MEQEVQSLQQIEQKLQSLQLWNILCKSIEPYFLIH